MNRLHAILSFCAVLICGACLPLGKNIPGLKKLTAPKSGPKTQAFHKNYCTDHDRRVIRQGTPLAVLLWEDKCSSGMSTCDAGLDAAKGTLPAQYETLFRDLLDATTQETGGPRFVYETCNVTSKAEPYTIAIDGLGLMRSKEHAGFLIDFIAEHGHRYFTDDSTPRRLARALFLTGKSKAAEQALGSMLAMPPQVSGFRAETLKYLATWESTAGVDYCTETLSVGKGRTEACLWYLGAVRHSDAYELVVRRMEDEEEEAIRALGHLGDARAIPILEKRLESTRSVPLQGAALVALMNLGAHDRFPEFERLLRGRTLLSSGAETASPKISVMERATFEALEFEDAQLRTRSFRYVESLGDLEGESGAWRVPVFLNAARASVGDDDAVEKLGTLLDDPRKDVRHLVVRVVGSNFDQLHGVRVADRALFEPLTRAYEMEPSGGEKRAIVLAIAYIGAG